AGRQPPDPPPRWDRPDPAGRGRVGRPDPPPDAPPDDPGRPVLQADRRLSHGHLRPVLHALDRRVLVEVVAHPRHDRDGARPALQEHLGAPDGAARLLGGGQLAPAALLRRVVPGPPALRGRQPRLPRGLLQLPALLDDSHGALGDGGRVAHRAGRAPPRAAHVFLALDHPNGLPDRQVPLARALPAPRRARAGAPALLRTAGHGPGTAQHRPAAGRPWLHPPALADPHGAHERGRAGVLVADQADLPRGHPLGDVLFPERLPQRGAARHPEGRVAQDAVLGERDGPPRRPLLRGAELARTPDGPRIDPDPRLRLGPSPDHPVLPHPPVAPARLAPAAIGGGRGMIVRAEHLNKWYGRVLGIHTQA